MRLTNEQLLLLLAWAGDDGITVSQLSDRLGVPAREAWWRFRRLELRGLAERGATRGRDGARGRPGRVFRLPSPLRPCAPPCSENDTAA
jgi:predicted ArsR family transcriptional regulator